MRRGYRVSNAYGMLLLHLMAAQKETVPVAQRFSTGSQGHVIFIAEDADGGSYKTAAEVSTRIPRALESTSAEQLTGASFMSQPDQIQNL